MRKAVWCILFLTSGCIAATAQQYLNSRMLSDAGFSSPSTSLSSTQEIFPTRHLDPYHDNLRFGREQLSPKPAMQVIPLSPDFYYAHCYGFFCKIEWMTQEKLHIPLSFRLGTYSYERKLEGK